MGPLGCPASITALLPPHLHGPGLTFGIHGLCEAQASDRASGPLCLRPCPSGACLSCTAMCPPRRLTLGPLCFHQCWAALWRAPHPPAQTRCPPCTPWPPSSPAYMPPLTPIKCLGLDRLGGDGAGTPVFMCHAIRPMTREQRACLHAFERFDVTVAGCTGQPWCLLRALALSSVCVMTNSDALATGRLGCVSLARSEAHTRLATARPGSGLGQNPKGPTRVPPCHPRTGTLPPLREPVCRREEANAETANNGVRVT